jgi:hypothetical protein
MIAMPEEFNSVESSIDNVKAHVKENPDSATAILEAEQARPEADRRGSLISWLEKKLNPVTPEKPSGVEVSPAEPANTRSFHGKSYEVTPEGGHRLVQ